MRRFVPLAALLGVALVLGCQDQGSGLEESGGPGSIVIVNAHQLGNLVSVQFRLNGGDMREAFKGNTFTYGNVGPGSHSLSFVGCDGLICFFNGDGPVCNFDVTSGESKIITLSGGDTNLVTVACP